MIDSDALLDLIEAICDAEVGKDPALETIDRKARQWNLKPRHTATLWRVVSGEPVFSLTIRNLQSALDDLNQATRSADARAIPVEHVRVK